MTSYSNRSKTHHSAYYYAKKYGWTYSDATTYTESYLDECQLFKGNGLYSCAVGFNPILLGVAISMDIGVAISRDVKTIVDPVERAKAVAELKHNLRKLRRPFYYARETARRRQLAEERRKLSRRTTLAPMPTAEALLDAWNRRKESKENMILLGGMLHDLECYVDNRLKFDGDGKVVGRNRGIRGWIACNLPELSARYKTLMRYKAMAIRLRQATGTVDPKPTSHLLTESPRHEVVETILENFRTTFSSIEETLAFYLSPETVLRDKPKGLETARNRKGRLKEAGAPS